MTRRWFLTGLSVMASVSACLGSSTSQKKWYITGGRRKTQNDCTVEPIISYGRDRVEAVANSGITVWSEEEWLASSPDSFYRDCKANGALTPPAGDDKE